MSARVFATPAALLDAVGENFGPTEWVTIEQERIDLFARATDDHQWIHVDPERAKDGPFGSTIAHGYLTMSLVNRFLPDLVEVRGVSMGINIGTDTLRFLNPVRTGSRIRGVGELVKAEEAKGGVQAVVRVTVEIEGEEKPACVVDTISRFYPDS
ncbi:MaoC family dehydratase [Sphingopyxis sp. DBS4]|uniref:MaoC family dehydratase n=1 Tax=Sphingopyxis sp. DBS4 TaxID=2968500 RepID=UPI00214C7786|nr:MaoC family dehydratase [Sphingopyxis sp. DBS4]